MVTFAKRLRPSTKFEVRRPSRSEDTAHLVCVSCLSTTVSQLSEPQLQKNRHFYVPGLQGIDQVAIISCNLHQN